MTNRELLNTPEKLLKELDRQRLYLLRIDGTSMPCPACKKPVNLFDAAGIELDSYDFGVTKYAFRCPACGAALEQIVPFISGGGELWHWQIKDSWLQEQLRKAKANDESKALRPGRLEH
jgi:uncharacterized protein (UPF0212 family)